MFSFKAVTLLFCCVTSISFQGASSSISVENSKVLFEFDATSGSLSKLIDKTSESGYDLIGIYTNAYPLWDITFVDSVGTIGVDNVGRTMQHRLDKAFNIQTLTLTWNSIAVTGKADKSVVDVALKITLIDESSVSYWGISVDVVNETSIGVWQAKVSIPFTVGNDEYGELFFPSGYGTLYSNPVRTAGGGVSSSYPGSGATMQFMALGSRDVTSGGYVAALDSNAEPKQLQYFTSTAWDSPADVSDMHAEVYGPHGPRVGDVQSFPLRKNAATPKLSFLSVTMYPRDAGVAISPGEKWTSSYLLAVGVVTNISSSSGRPLWFESSSVYRDWALADAKWTKKGSFKSREDPALPDWYRSNSIWLNTHWQCHDIFNETGGDPTFVAENTKAIAQTLGQNSVALHWYEWQQGPDPAPEARYKFDTHYPDYFPPRNAFRDAVNELREESGVYTVPYINGRIFDIASDSYLADNGNQYCTKYLKTVKRIDDKNDIDLVSYEETYGSDASFCVANPYSPYWQTKLADTVDELVNDWAVDGVYIDQIGSAVPKMCWDDAHGHTLGGGSWWRDGYEQMLEAIAARTVRSGGEASVPIVTEDNAEPYMDSLQGYLTLVAFKCSLQQQATPSSTGYKQLVPAFPAVYGGYFVGFGAQWYQLDFDDHDWWRGKLAATFVTGTQMGWFSITGVNNDPDDSCGNMAVGDLMLSADNTDLMDYLKLLASFRASLVDCFVDGSVTRPAILDPQPQLLTQKIASGGYPPFDYDSVTMMSWTLASDVSSHTVLTVLASATSESFTSTLTVNFANWGFNDSDLLSVSGVSSVGERTHLMDITGPVSSLEVKVPAVGVLALEFAVGISSKH